MKGEKIRELKKLKKEIEEIKIGYDYEENYRNLYNNCTNYENDTQNFIFEELFNDFIDYDTAEEIAKSELERGGLIRLYYFLGDCNFNNEIFKINGYGNLKDITKEDFDILKDEVIDIINENIED